MNTPKDLGPEVRHGVMFRKEVGSHLAGFALMANIRQVLLDPDGKSPASLTNIQDVATSTPYDIHKVGARACKGSVDCEVFVVPPHCVDVVNEGTHQTPRCVTRGGPWLR